jgi:hypothetical protein
VDALGEGNRDPFALEGALDREYQLAFDVVDPAHARPGDPHPRLEDDRRIAKGRGDDVGRWGLLYHFYVLGRLFEYRLDGIQIAVVIDPDLDGDPDLVVLREVRVLLFGDSIVRH